MICRIVMKISNLFIKFKKIKNALTKKYVRILGRPISAWGCAARPKLPAKVGAPYPLKKEK